MAVISARTLAMNGQVLDIQSISRADDETAVTAPTGRRGRPCRAHAPTEHPGARPRPDTADSGDGRGHGYPRLPAARRGRVSGAPSDGIARAGGRPHA